VSVELLQTAAATLGELVHDVVFVGGATITLWITDPGAPQRLTVHPRFSDGVYGALRPDAASQARAEQIVGPRLRAIVAAR
jgi:hypothetical protein